MSFKVIQLLPEAVSFRSRVLIEKSSRGAAFGDVDNDGDIDVLVVNMNERPTLPTRKIPQDAPARRCTMVAPTGRRSVERRELVGLAVLLMAVSAVSPVRGQAAPPNLLVDRVGSGAWEPRDDARPEQFLGHACLAVRSPGTFTQAVVLSAAAAGTYAVLAGLGQSDRINTDDSITGMPYLYATVWARDTKRVLAYWQGANSLVKRQVGPAMLARPESPTDWVKMYGLFEVPKGAALIRVQLSQGERRGSPPDGSVARFRDIRLHLFPTEREARAFVDRYVPE